MVVGHKDGIVMIESGAKEETEEVILAAIEFAHAEIKKIVAAIDELVSKAGKPKRSFVAPTTDEGYYDELKTKIGDRLKDALDTKKYAKTDSYALVKKIKDELAAELPADDPNAKKKLATYYELLRERTLPRAGDEGSDSSRSPRFRRDSRDHDRDQRSASHAWFGTLHTRRNTGTGDGDAGYGR